MHLEGKIISVNVTVLLAALVILGLTSVSIAAEDVSSLVKQVMPGVVLIQTFDSNGNGLGQGSGFVINSEGDVVTCYHVMRGYSTAIVTTADEKKFQVRNVTTLNKSDDLIRISLSADNHSFSNLSLNTTTPEVGQEVIAIGGPLGLEKTVSQGIVSAIRNNTIQITAPISPGSSGGPVFNMKGEVIGIVSSQMKSGQNLNFAIPANLIPVMKLPSVEQIEELREPYDSTEIISEDVYNKAVTKGIEKGIEQGISRCYLVQSVKCNIFDNKSMLVKIYIADNVDARELNFRDQNVEQMLRLGISGYIAAVNVDPLIEDMTLQICNSTAIQCTMHSYRSLISMSVDEVLDKPGYVDTLKDKMLSTMTPVIGSHRVSGKWVPVEVYY